MKEIKNIGYYRLCCRLCRLAKTCDMVAIKHLNYMITIQTYDSTELSFRFGAHMRENLAFNGDRKLALEA